MKATALPTSLPARLVSTAITSRAWTSALACLVLSTVTFTLVDTLQAQKTQEGVLSAYSVRLWAAGHRRSEGGLTPQTVHLLKTWSNVHPAGDETARPSIQFNASSFPGPDGSAPVVRAVLRESEISTTGASTTRAWQTTSQFSPEHTERQYALAASDHGGPRNNLLLYFLIGALSTLTVVATRR
jgi:hypothetical protein